MATPLEQLRDQLALAVGENAAFDGWNAQAVANAAAQQGIDPAKAQLAFPKDQATMIDCYIRGVDRALEAAFPPDRVAAMKVRDRIREMIWHRLETMAPAREAVRTGLSILSLPHNLPTALAAGWRTADLVWRLAGDTATDYNHYTKRLTLSAVYAATLLAWLDDQSAGWSETRAFLDRRLADVLRFEKFKASLARSDLHRPSLTRFLGRLRYPPK